MQSIVNKYNQSYINTNIEKYNSQTKMQQKGVPQLKKLVTNMDSNRKNIESKTDIPGNIAQSKQSFNELQSVIKGQTSTLSSLRQFEKSMSTQNTRNLEVKKFFLAFTEQMKQEITKLIKIGQNIFTTTTGQKNKEDDYQKVTTELLKLMNTVRQQADTSQKMYNVVFRFLAKRDNFICQLLRVMLYKKNVLWRDLNMKFDDYIHGEVKASLNKIKENQEKYGYVPTSLHYRIPKIDADADSPLYDLLMIVFQDQAQLLDSMKNFSKLSQEPQLIEDISKNQHIVKSLRQKIQVLTKNYNTLLQKYRALQISKGKVQLTPNQQKSLADKIEDIEFELQRKSQEYLDLKQTYMKSENTIQSLKQKNKELEDEISKWQNYQLPKIKQLELIQKTLFEEFSKVKKDFQAYSALYEGEREEKIKAYSDLKDEKNRISEMANILGRERRKIKELKSQIMRKDQIIMELVEKAPDPDN